MINLTKDDSIICSVLYALQTLIVAVFSACAEMFPTLCHRWCPLTKFSLHAQRCFHIRQFLQSPYHVFSACAEMFPISESGKLREERFLCMRRDVSGYSVSNGYITLVFSACAEMFPIVEMPSDSMTSFLCMRRDVSGPFPFVESGKLFSLHAQRCFSHRRCRDRGWKVFSACAEMFPQPRP